MNIQETIRAARFPLLADGAWGTELMKHGAATGDAPERLNVTSPEIVRRVAENYVSAGADIILTNSFGGNRFQLARHALAESVVELNRAAAVLSKGAAGSSVAVAGSMGPSGKLLITGDVTPDELYAAFLEQAQALVAGGVDILLAETMTDMEEMLLAVAAAR